MKSIFALAAAAAAFLTPAAAGAATYVAEIDLDPGHVNQFGHFVAPLPGGPVTLEPGGMLDGTITFANEGRLTVFNNVSDNSTDREWVLGLFRAAGPALTEVTWNFLGVEGDYKGPTVQTGTCGNAICFGTPIDLTPTSFSFTGISFQARHISGSTMFDPEDLGIYRGAFAISENVAAVPEPGTWLTMIFGFGVLGGALRRRRIGTPPLATA
jgi:hypothetical protein